MVVAILTKYQDYWCLCKLVREDVNIVDNAFTLLWIIKHQQNLKNYGLGSNPQLMSLANYSIFNVQLHRSLHKIYFISETRLLLKSSILSD